MDEYLFTLGDAPTNESFPRDALANKLEIQEIRQAFDKAGISHQLDRQHLIVQALGRNVQALTEVKSSEVKTIVYRILDSIAGEQAKSTRSAWDDRDEDTWIDKL
ncbi:hypothetical protein [Glutamicibacter arilaitensis]|uniref:hypothetical protein n=1 Tax=Glutamicibacter TaxID=1742989 RepID=UPI003F8E6B31